jgi:putative SOS response-associated peptidase YedK
MVVRRDFRTGQRHLDMLRWGLVPHFYKGQLEAALRPINARSETAGVFGMFRSALAARRCLVPAAAFYEWQAGQPYALARADGEPLALAGLWDGWLDSKGVLLWSFTILTTAANATMRALHERMPVVLDPADWPVWLGEAEGDPTDLMRPAGDDVLRLWPVSRAVNSVRNNGAALLDRIDDPDAPPPSDGPPGNNPA